MRWQHNFAGFAPARAATYQWIDWYNEFVSTKRLTT
jgi:hypothetical protein